MRTDDLAGDTDVGESRLRPERKRRGRPARKTLVRVWAVAATTGGAE